MKSLPTLRSMGKERAASLESGASSNQRCWTDQGSAHIAQAVVCGRRDVSVCLRESEVMDP